MNKYVYLILLYSLIIGKDMSKSDNYEYDLNGRVIIPDDNVISSLSKDGGSHWNRLIFEKSPYLLQHAANPVDWYPWSDEAFELAKQLNKPVFLSIGYSTCHWCHVMEHESFEDKEVSTLMNDAFINIKVDREERPDIDNVYMAVTQKLTGRGGWPMTVIMTPDKKPFFAGTYFPKKSKPRYNRPGMLEIIPQIKELWESKNDSLLSSAESIVENINKSQTTSVTNNIKLNSTILDDSFRSFKNRFDNVYGGFTNSRNKFPKPHDYSFLCRYYLKTGNQEALDIVVKSLEEMRKGGIFDQIGYGFHRYSTDKKWLVPHFEKMLYDQALLIHAYLDVYQITNNKIFSKTVHEICEYVLSTMSDSKGGFYSAEDADSQGQEGTFYIWSSEELREILDDDEYLFISSNLNIKNDGNCYVEGERTNIPHLSNFLDSKDEEKFNVVRKKIFTHRELRVHPLKDDKILTDWNGLMISALSRASILLDSPKYLEAAEKSANFIIDNLIVDDQKLLKRYRNNHSGIDGMIEDYAFFIWGLIELYQSTFNEKYIELAAKLSDYQIEHFWDLDNGGFNFTSDLTEKLIINSKEIYDGAIPSGNSVSAYNFIRLSRILSRYDYEEISLKIFDTFSSKLNRYSSGSTMLLQAISFVEGPSYEIIIAGDKSKSQSFIKYLQKHIQPNKVIILKSSNKIFNYLDLYKSKKDGNPLVYVCQNYSCKLPTDDINKIDEMLK
mgnify:CR=1 FL=1|tara:strand:- start:5329 stop:7503 length:2175 start_codon:yes stop_codon:yes gene_type:complete